MVSDTTVTLGWSRPDNATYYKVSVAKKGSNAIVVRHARANGLTYTVSNLERGQKYWWFVEACNEDKCTSSDNYFFEVEAPPVGTPTITSVNIYETMVGIYWTEVTGATKYRIALYDLTGDDDRYQYEEDRESTSFQNLKRGHRYKVKVRAYIESRRGSYSSYKYFDIPDADKHCALDNFTNKRLSETFNYGDKDTDKGGSKTQVRELQRFLNDLGHDAGTPDGIYGDNTYYAVRRYQGSQGLDADGIVGTNTKNAINNTSCD
jgi:hypothetical protein